MAAAVVVATSKPVRLGAWLAPLLLLLTACSSAPPVRPTHPPAAPRPPTFAPGTGSQSDLAFRALGLVGTPYRRAGADPAIGFDCSGFVVYLYRDVLGLTLPRTTAELYRLPGRSPRPVALRTGDLVFFDTGGRGVSHVGVYVGEGRFVHAPNQGGRVRLDRLDDPYWRPRYLGARRLG